MNKYKKIKSYYDEYGSWYDDERIKGYYSFINDIEIKAVKDFGAGKRVLEIGCGTGIILNEVNKFAKEAWGIDLSSGMLKAAKRKGLNVKEANATDLPFNDNEFDVIYSFKVLAHIPEIEKVIKEVYRVLKMDGIAILEFYNPYSLKAVANRLQKSKDKVYVRFDSLKNIKNYYSDKFEILEIRGARILLPASFLMKIPILNSLIAFLEKVASRTILGKLAGYMILIARKKSK